MPKKVHDLVDKLLDSSGFYPNKSEKEREDAAWGTATNIEKKKKSKKKSKAEFVEDLLKIANELDDKEFVIEADIITKLASNLLNNKNIKLAQSDEDFDTKDDDLYFDDTPKHHGINNDKIGGSTSVSAFNFGANNAKCPFCKSDTIMDDENEYVDCPNCSAWASYDDGKWHSGDPEGDIDEEQAMDNAASFDWRDYPTFNMRPENLY